MPLRKILVIALSLVCAGPALASDPIERHNSNALWFENWVGFSNATLTVQSPGGKSLSVYTQSGTPVFQLSGNDILDGIYIYELNAATDETVQVTQKVNNGRGANAKDSHKKPFYMNGSFTVSRGVIITPEHVEEDK